MMDIKRLDLKLLSDKELKVYERFVPEEFHCYLHCQNPNNSDLVYIAITATEDEELVGLLLASATKSVYTAEIHSLFVDEKKRHQHIATNLMLYLEQELKNASCIMVTMFYPSDIQNEGIFKSLLQKLEWMNPVPLIDRYLFEGKIFQPLWLFNEYHYPENTTLFPWEKLTESERQELLRQEAQSRFPKEVSPFFNESKIELLNSLGLKKNDEIIGWMITHRFNPSTIHYSALYIQPEYQFSNLSIRPLIEAIKIQKNAIENGHPAIYALFDLNRIQTDNNWQHFIKRRLAPYAQKTTILYHTWKNLSVN